MFEKFRKQLGIESGDMTLNATAVGAGEAVDPAPSRKASQKKMAKLADALMQAWA